MLIVEIAGGIVLGVVLVTYWRAVLALGGLALAAITVGLLAILVVSTDWRIGWQDIAAVVLVASSVAGALRLHKHRHPDATF